MSKTPYNLERQADRFMPPNAGMNDLKPNRLFVLMVIGMGLTGLFVFVLDLFLYFQEVAMLCLSLAVGSIFSLWLFKNGHTLVAKLITHLHVLVVIFIITVLYSEHVFVWAFLIPVTISALVVFAQRERFFSYLVIALTLLSIPLYILVHENSNNEILHQPIVHAIWIANLIGSLLFSMLIVTTLVRLNASITEQLQAKSVENDRQNKIMLGSIRTRDKLLSMMSHDVRGDIGKTIGVVDVIEQMSLSKEDQANLLHSLKLDAIKTLETLDNMLQWTRTQQDELNVNMQPYAVDRLLSQLLSSFDYALNTKRISVQLNVPGNLSILADHNMIESVFRNLLGNAIKFTPIGGVISLSAKAVETSLEFTIQDSGIGMTAEQIDNITRGIQFTTRGTNREKGRGFGMVLVNEFLGKHKSPLTIDSTLGKGTRFMFHLPLNSSK